MNEKTHAEGTHPYLGRSPSSISRNDAYARGFTDGSSLDPLGKTSSKAIEAGVSMRVLSRIRTKDSIAPTSPAPDGGVKAWTQALLCHLVLFNTWGIINSFGLFETYYTTALNETPSAVSWIGSLQLFLPFVIGTFSGRATDAGFFRPTIVVGMIIQLLGIYTTSLCKTYWQILLAQGVCVGVGNGLVFVPSMTVLSTYFDQNRAFAIGVAASGAATGGLVYPAIAECLLYKIGFPWTVRVMGLVATVTMIPSTFLLQPRIPPRKSGPLVEWGAFRELPFTLFVLASFFTFWGLYAVFYYIGSFGRDILHTSESTSISLLLTMNGVGLPGRIIPNYVASKVTGPLNLMIIFSGISSVIMFCWIVVDTVTGVWVFAVIYGVFAAGCQSLFPATATSLTTDPKLAGVRLGMCFSVVAFAVLSGPPIAGALIEQNNGDYLYMQLWAALSMTIACAMLVAARKAKTGWALGVKV